MYVRARRRRAAFACALLLATAVIPVQTASAQSPLERAIERARQIARAARGGGELPEPDAESFRDVLATLDLDGVVPFEEELIDLAWQRRRRGTSRGTVRGGGFTFRAEKPVRQFVTYFSRGAGRRTFETGLRRSGLYRPLAEQIFRDEGVPTDLIWLAQVESLWKPWALSSASAKGLWQFIPSTGRRFGLDRTHWTDERADPYAATRAAARYLKFLNRHFKGDWLLALAAYNAGEGAVGRAVARTGRADFWHLYNRGALPRETRNYVPAILATILIAREPDSYGIRATPAAPWRFETADVGGKTDLRVVAELCGTRLEDVWQNNPELRRGVTPPGRYRLRLPHGSRGRFLAAYRRFETLDARR
jgi:hypothetical protein